MEYRCYSMKHGDIGIPLALYHNITCCATRCNQSIIYTLKTDRIMIQTDSETFQMMLHQIMERFDRIEDRLSRMNRQTSALDGDKLLDNQDMCELLGITKRTLARYRQKKLVTYYMIDGRTYYKSSEVEAFLNQKGRRLPARLKNQMEN